ncbi:MAG: Wzz/FepE/Etk N-terminal domain-containing protein [Clostridiales bacterium]|nr:Wzz/FepE/Etk N-terminal domain-containing protein [Clostridiales bacterium]
MENTENQRQFSREEPYSRERTPQRSSQQGQQQPEQIDLVEVCSVLIHRWRFLLLGIIIGALIGGGYVYVQPYEYESTAMVYNISDSSSSVSSILSDLELGSTVIEDFEIVANSNTVIDTAIEQVEDEMGVTLTRDYIKEELSVTSEEDTHVLMFSVTDEDPELACAISNAVAEATVSLMANILDSDPSVIFEKAEAEYEPIDNGLMKTAAMGGVVGFVIVAILFLIPYFLNDKISTKQDVEKYVGYGVLGIIPLDKNHETKKKQRK